MPRAANYLSDVKSQYEDLPYPPRNPQDEAKRLMTTSADHLERINHYGYGGQQTFREGFRCLVAGGGTGDSSVFLGEQFRHIDHVEIVHLDLSCASIQIAQRAGEDPQTRQRRIRPRFSLGCRKNGFGHV